MSSQKLAAKVYRDFEKLFRLGALYQGNTKPLEQHIKIVESNLRHCFSGVDARDSLQFDFNMDGVMYGGKSIFTSEHPETTLAYGLFCEGVQSITVMRDLTAQQLLDFCFKIRAYLEANEDGKDLASMLWKQTFSNLRVFLYSLLLEQSGAAKPALEQNEEGGFASRDGSEGGSGADWNKKDPDWDLPSGELASHHLTTSDDLNQKRVDQMREELSDVSVSDRAQRIVRFEGTELESLAHEFESYDENQVQFNILAQAFAILQSQNAANELPASFVENIGKAIAGILDRFHGGLLAYVLGELESATKKQKGGQALKQIQEQVHRSLHDFKRLSVFADSLEKPNRLQVCKSLMHYFSEQSHLFLFEILQEKGNVSLLSKYIQLLIELNPQAETLILKTNDRVLLAVVPVVAAQKNWLSRQAFLIRCLNHRSPEIVRAVLASMNEIQMPTAEALRLFKKLAERERKVWGQALLNLKDFSPWAAFLKEIVNSQMWMQADEEGMFVWARLAWEALGSQALTSFEPFLIGRRFFLWAKFPKPREAILSAALQTKDKKMRGLLEEILKREAQLIFQDSELKEKLRLA